jgi:hypothetical protein
MKALVITQYYNTLIIYKQNIVFLCQVFFTSQKMASCELLIYILMEAILLFDSLASCPREDA